MSMLTPITTSQRDSQRLSVASTAGTSFFTARASPISPSSPTADDDDDDSTTTTPRPMFAKQELHLVKISGDTLSLDSNPVSPTPVFHRKTVMHVVSSDVPVLTHAHTLPFNTIGPPPPSPPASIKHPDDPDVSRLFMHIPPSQSDTPSPPTILLKDAVPLERTRSPPFQHPHDRSGSTDSRDTQRGLPRSLPSSFPKPSPPTHTDLRHRSSTDTRLSTVSARTGASSSTRAPRTLPFSDGISEVLAADQSFNGSPSGSASPPSAKHARGHVSSLSQSQSPDGHLQPPAGSFAPHRPTRRNTTGGHIRPVRSAPQAGYGYDVDTDIEDDIQLQAEQIRRERKRAKAQKDAEEALTRTSSKRRGSLGKEDENKVLVGNLIGEDHVNYVLMYNMLTGIRIAVSLSTAL